MPTSLREHEGVVQAILAGDAELTAQRLRDHVVVQGQRFADLVASLAELRKPGAGRGEETGGPAAAAAPPRHE